MATIELSHNELQALVYVLNMCTHKLPKRAQAKIDAAYEQERAKRIAAQG